MGARTVGDEEVEMWDVVVPCRRIGSGPPGRIRTGDCMPDGCYGGWLRQHAWNVVVWENSVVEGRELGMPFSEIWGHMRDH